MLGSHRRLGIEQPSLGLEVLLEVPMEVQVILRKIGERADVEADAVDASESERVTGHLHDDGIDPLLCHHGEQSMELRSFRSGQSAGHPTAVDPSLDGAHQPRLAAGSGNRRFEQVRRRGLAGCAGNADDLHLLRGPSVDLR